MSGGETSGAAKASGFARQWHHRPDVPIGVSPLFTWPLDLKRVVTWFAARWFNIAENAIIALLAIAC